MSNNKQSSVEWLRKKLLEKMQVWNSTKNYQEFHIVLEAGEFAKLIDEAKAMHKEEIENAYDDAIQDVRQDEERPLKGSEYYNIHFKKNG